MNFTCCDLWDQLDADLPHWSPLPKLQTLLDCFTPTINVQICCLNGGCISTEKHKVYERFIHLFPIPPKQSNLSPILQLNYVPPSYANADLLQDLFNDSIGCIATTQADRKKQPQELRPLSLNQGQHNYVMISKVQAFV